MTQLYNLAEVGAGWPTIQFSPVVAQAGSISALTDSFGKGIGGFLPTLLGALAVLFVGIIIAFIAAWIVGGILKSTTLDDKLASWVTGNTSGNLPTAKWGSTAAFWTVMLFTVIAVLNTLNLTVVSEPLNALLSTVLEYIPRIAGAAALLAVAWVIATVVKMLVSRGLSQFNLDEQLSQQTGVAADGSSFSPTNTLANVLYWFVFLLFLPLVLSALSLPGLLAPVEDLISQFLSAIPQILTAAIIFGIGWLVAKIVRGIVTNLLAASGVDRLGSRLGLASATGSDELSLSGLAGTVVFVMILLPVSISALEELNIEAISGPAVDMLNRVLFIVPQVIAATAVMVVFYFIGKFVSELVSNLLSGIGFDGIPSILGFADLPDSTPAAVPASSVQAPSSKTPSEIVGIITLVGIILFGAVTATEILGFPALTSIVQTIMAIAARVLIGVIIFAIGLYAANLAHRLVSTSMSGSASNTVANVARIAIIAFVGALALQQIGIAPSIVNLAFGLLLGAISVAIAIAFGLGGREVAGEQLRGWIEGLKR